MFNRYYSGKKKSGFAIILSLCVIMVLTLLIFAYNMLVMGKANETRHLSNHIAAFKCAQSTMAYIMANIKKDSVSTDIQRRQLIDDAFNNEDLDSYLEQIDYDGFAKALLDKYDGSVAAEATGKISQVSLLKNIAGDKDKNFYLDNEKAGVLQIKVLVSIGRTTEIYRVSRPFRIICPFPIGLTKFTLHLSKLSNQTDYFNKLNSGEAPLILNNAAPTLSSSNISSAEKWRSRGWIYLGPHKYWLNRYPGDNGYGQRYHSYTPGSGSPKALKLDFRDDVFTLNGEGMHVRSARWEFMNDLSQANSMWDQVLREALTGTSVKPSWLQLFGIIQECELEDGSHAQRNNNSEPSITRVIGKVFDRSVDVNYLFSNGTGSNSKVEAAIKFAKEETYDSACSGEAEGEESSLNKLLLINPSSAGNDGIFSGEGTLEELQHQIKDITYSNTSNNLLCYSTIMSQINSDPYDEIYSSIAQYMSNNSLEFPANPKYKEELPKMDDLSFYNQGSDLKVNTTIDKLLDIPCAGLKYRITHKVPINKFNNLIRVGQTHGGTYDLNNAVIKVSGSGGLKISGRVMGYGTIIAPESVYVMRLTSDVLQSETSQGGQSSLKLRKPVMIVSEKGNVSLSENEIDAFIAAPNGKIIPRQKKIKVHGGIAARSLDQCSGRLNYNGAFDPVTGALQTWTSIVLGPEGGQI